MRSSCNSEAAAVELAKALLQVSDHLPTCSSISHRKECREFVRRVLDNLSKELNRSYSASVSFIMHLSHASTTDGLYALKDPSVILEIFTVLQLVALVTVSITTSDAIRAAQRRNVATPAALGLSFRTKYQLPVMVVMSIKSANGLLPAASTESWRPI